MLLLRGVAGVTTIAGGNVICIPALFAYVFLCTGTPVSALRIQDARENHKILSSQPALPSGVIGEETSTVYTYLLPVNAPQEKGEPFGHMWVMDAWLKELPRPLPVERAGTILG